MAGGESLTVLTWNLGRVHLGRLGRWLGHDSRAHDRAMGHVARVLAAASADVIVLQELEGPWQLRKLAAHLGRDVVYASGGGDTDRVVGALALRPLGASCGPVPLAGGRCAVAVSTPAWVVLGVHLEPFDAPARARQAEELATWAAHRDEPTVVIAGDLNMDVRHPLHQAASDRTAMARLTTGAGGLRDLGAAAGPTVLLGRRLDYVLARGQLGAEAAVMRGVRVRLGDHDPLRATLRLPAEALARNMF